MPVSGGSRREGAASADDGGPEGGGARPGRADGSGPSAEHISTPPRTGDSEIERPGPATRAALVAIVGRANVGKSCLLNALLGEKVSIESPVAQTTRTVIRGILTEPRGQLAFLDTPGIHAARNDFGRQMNRMARAAVEGVDIALLVLDSSRSPESEDVGWMRRLAGHGSDAALVFALNKRDLGGAGIPALRAAWAEAFAQAAAPPPAPDWIEVSAKTGAGVEALRAALFARAPEQPPLFPPDVLSDHPRQLAIADVVREKLFLRLRDEIPHRVATAVEHLVETPDERRATVAVYVERASQKGIVIGYKGRMLRAVRRAAEAELQRMFGEPIALDLIVRVEPNWTKNYWFLKRIGYLP